MVLFPFEPASQLLSQSFRPRFISLASRSHLCVLNDSRLKALGILDIHGLNVAVQLLLGTLLVVTLSGDADTETERNALDAGFPDLLVELGI